jgi:hypothetical protein
MPIEPGKVYEFPYWSCFVRLCPAGYAHLIMYWMIWRPPDVVMRPVVDDSPFGSDRPFIANPFIANPFNDRPFIANPFIANPFIAKPFVDSRSSLFASTPDDISGAHDATKQGASSARNPALDRKIVCIVT